MQDVFIITRSYCQILFQFTSQLKEMGPIPCGQSRTVTKRRMQHLILNSFIYSNHHEHHYGSSIYPYGSEQERHREESVTLLVHGSRGHCLNFPRETHLYWQKGIFRATPKYRTTLEQDFTRWVAENVEMQESDLAIPPSCQIELFGNQQKHL